MKRASTIVAVLCEYPEKHAKISQNRQTSPAGLCCLATSRGKPRARLTVSGGSPPETPGCADRWNIAEDRFADSDQRSRRLKLIPIRWTGSGIRADDCGVNFRHDQGFISSDAFQNDAKPLMLISEDPWIDVRHTAY